MAAGKSTGYSRAPPVFASQSRTVSSYDADATTLLSGEKATDSTQPVCRLRVCRVPPVFASQSRTVSSYDAEATTLPSGEKATDKTQPVCPLSVLGAVDIGSILSNIVLAALSFDFDVTSFLSGGDNATVLLSSELIVLFDTSFSVAADSLVDDRFGKVSDSRVGSAVPLL